MKKLFLAVAILALAMMATTAWAVSLICDPQAGVTEYQLTGPVWVPATIPAEANGSIKLNLANAIEGNNALTIKACRDDALWGMLCSDAVPFGFTRPSAPGIAGGVKLIP